MDRLTVIWKIGLAFLSAAGGIALAIILYVTALAPLLDVSSFPHVYKAAELKAIPEAQLVYPGSYLVKEVVEDEVPASIVPERFAYVQREMTFTGSPFDVMPWFRDRLEPNGWVRQPTPASGGYSWTKKDYIFQLEVCGDGGDGFFSQSPCPSHFWVDIWAH